MNQQNDASRKSPRTFQCRDQLWETFEQMARELECSIDYLINEAMKQYARQRSYGGAQQGAGSSRTPFPGARDTGVDQPTQRPPLPPTAPAVPMARPSAPTPPPVPTGGRLPPPPPPPPGGRLPPPPPPTTGRQQPVAPAPPPPPVSRGPMGGPPPLPRGSMPPSPPPMQHHQHAPPMQVPIQPAFLGGLTAIYQGERTSVNKEKFIIGRGRQTSDLTIKDPNVSRQHAMVEFQNGVYYMVDLGSTNGVEYQGQRVTRKAIAEGDSFRICDHEVVFTYR